MIQRIPCEIDGKKWAVNGTNRCLFHSRPEDLQKRAQYRMINSMDKKLLIEKIETKIEEYREAIDEGKGHKHHFLMNFEHHEGVITGLKLALDIINE